MISALAETATEPQSRPTVWIPSAHSAAHNGARFENPFGSNRKACNEQQGPNSNHDNLARRVEKSGGTVARHLGKQAP